ncbi:MAG: hypothetical protein ACR2RV_12775, partial [Verrucomicrobiales bacterium]
MDFTENLNDVKRFLWGQKWRRRATIAIGLAVTILGGAWLLIELILIPKAARRLDHELAKLGIHITYEDPDLSLWQGSLSLSEIVLHRTAMKDERLLSISEFGVKIDLDELIWRQALWGQGSTHDASIVVYGENRTLQFDRLSAEIEIDSDRLSILRCTSTTNIGYHLDLAGTLRWGQSQPAREDIAVESSTSSRPAEPAAPTHVTDPVDGLPDFPGDLVWLEDVADFFICEPQGEELATLIVELKWDETTTPPRGEDGSTITNHQLCLIGSISGRDLTWKNFPLQGLGASFSIENWMVEVSDLSLTGLQGEATLSGRYDLDSHQLAVNQLHSTMDPIEVIERLDPVLAEPLQGIEYDHPPSLSGKGLMIDFDDLRESEVQLRLEAPRGIRYREELEDDEVLELLPLSATIVYEDSPNLQIEDIKTRIRGLDVQGMVTLQQASQPEPGTSTVNEISPTPASPAGRATENQVRAAGGPPTEDA